MATLIAKLSPDRTFRLSKSVTSIGRGPQNDVRIPDGTLEDRHAHVLKDRDGFRIFAADGAKLVVNGRRRNEWPLADGDEVELGGIRLVYRASDLMMEEQTDPDVPLPARATSRPKPTSTPVRAPSPLERSISIAETVPAEALKRLYQF